MLLSLQRYSEAWLLHEGRLKLDEFTFKNSHFDNIKQKLWNQKKINQDDKILIIKEQGVGDEIIFSSMYPDLLKQFPNAVIETDPRLISLFKRSFKINKQVNTFVEYSFYSKSKIEIE